MSSGDLTRDVTAYARCAAQLSVAGAQERERLLAARGLDEDAWEAIDEAWSERFSAAEDEAGDGAPQLLVAFADAFARAQREVAADEPLLSFDAFVSATRELASGRAPETALTRLGISLGTYLKTQQSWTRRFIEDPELAARFVRALAGEGT